MAKKMRRAFSFKVSQVEISKIAGNPYQTRLAIDKASLLVLIKSIRERGLFSPITLLKKSGDKYIVVSGHRRLAACKRLKWKKIAAFVRKRNEKNTLIIDLIHENLVREDLTVQEKALTIKLLFSHKIKSLNNVDEIISCITAGKLFIRRHPERESQTRVKTKFSDADMFQGIKLLKTIGMSANNAISYLTVLKLPPKIQRMVSFNVHNDQGERSQRISIRMAYNIARVEDRQFQDYLFERAKQGYSARIVEALVNNYKLKVLKGEWAGFVKKTNNVKVITALDKQLFINLSQECGKLARKLNSWKIIKLSALSETMEKELFIASALDLRKEMRIVDNQLKKRLVEKGYVNVENKSDNEPFELRVKEMADGKKNCRGTIPMRILIRLGLERGKLKVGSFVQLKVVGVRAADVKKR